eukprot:scaffold48_cov311-Pinguiococcus_pyrenoidosus.AAC.207
MDWKAMRLCTHHCSGRNDRIIPGIELRLWQEGHGRFLLLRLQPVVQKPLLDFAVVIAANFFQILFDLSLALGLGHLQALHGHDGLVPVNICSGRQHHRAQQPAENCRIGGLRSVDGPTARHLAKQHVHHLRRTQPRASRHWPACRGLRHEALGSSADPREDDCHAGRTHRRSTVSGCPAIQRFNAGRAVGCSAELVEEASVLRLF